MADTTTLDSVAEDTPMSTEETLAQLTSLKASATKEYSLRNYTTAAELYSQATELQADLNGEMNTENADLLYFYGRCLYHVAVSKSDVLGGKVAGREEPKRKKRKTEATNGEGAGDALKKGEEKLAEEVVEAVLEENTGANGAKKEDDIANKPFFQITGDENWTDSEDEDGDEGAEGDDEEDDDFATAYEILDVARVLLTKKLEALEQQAQDSAGKGKAAQSDTPLSPESRAIMERLADTHDLQAEISLENERFADAVTDSQSSLDLKLRLNPKESSLVAEAHFKLSLALEFASVTTIQADDQGNVQSEDKTETVDEDLRKESAQHMEHAIESCRLRVSKEKASLPGLQGDKKKEKQKSIKDVEEMVVDMEQRLVDLRNPAVSMNGSTGPAGAPDGSNPLGGILGSLLGESASQQKTRIAEATKGANDLTGLIRKKPQKAEAVAPVAAAEGASKRKLDEDEGVSQVNGKKAKVEDA